MFTLIDTILIILASVAVTCAGLIITDSLRRYCEDRASGKLGAAVAEAGETQKGRCTFCGQWDDYGRPVYFDGKRVGYTCSSCERTTTRQFSS